MENILMFTRLLHLISPFRPVFARSSSIEFYLGCDKIRESRNWGSKATNGLRIRIPGDRKPGIKY